LIQMLYPVSQKSRSLRLSFKLPASDPFPVVIKECAEEITTKISSD
jgi:hypothetical protein